MTVRQCLLLVAVLVSLGAASGCASTARPAVPAVSHTAAGAPTGLPGWNGPSDAAHLVCTSEAVEEISGALGLTLTRPLAPTWTDHRYACTYHYPVGPLQLSVKDLSDAAATTAWFAGLRDAGGAVTPVSGMGDQAFQRADGTVVVRKDTTVLVVDVAALPAQLGNPSRARAVAARTVATTVLICWKEA